VKSPTRAGIEAVATRETGSEFLRGGRSFSEGRKEAWDLLLRK